MPRGFLVVIGKDDKPQTHKVDYQQDTDLAPLLSLVLGGAGS